MYVYIHIHNSINMQSCFLFLIFHLNDVIHYVSFFKLAYFQHCVLETSLFYILESLLSLYKLHGSTLNEQNIFYLSILLLMTSRQFLMFCHHSNAGGSICVPRCAKVSEHLRGEVATPRHRLCAFPLAGLRASRLKTCGLNLHR